MTDLPKLGIISGGGAAPWRLIETCQRLGRDFFVFCLEGQADEGLASDVPHLWLPLGAGEKLRKACKEQGVKEIVMIGKVRRPSLAELKPDLWTLKILMKIGLNSLGDDGLLKAIATVFEEEGGVRVIGAHEVFSELISPAGALTSLLPDQAQLADIYRGQKVASALGVLDIGQSVVVQQGLVLGVEAAEGTEQLILRCAALRREGQGPVLVKWAKPQQDTRFDLPALGPATVAQAIEAGFCGIVFEAGRSLLIDRAAMIAAAQKAGLFLYGLNGAELQAENSDAAAGAFVPNQTLAELG